MPKDRLQVNLAAEGARQMRHGAARGSDALDVASKLALRQRRSAYVAAGTLRVGY